MQGDLAFSSGWVHGGLSHVCPGQPCLAALKHVQDVWPNRPRWHSSHSCIAAVQAVFAHVFAHLLHAFIHEYLPVSLTIDPGMFIWEPSSRLRKLQPQRHVGTYVAIYCILHKVSACNMNLGGRQ